MNNILKAAEIRGSEWRKWDLHIHTPVSLCSEYGGQSDDVWTKFFETLEELSEDIKVIAKRFLNDQALPAVILKVQADCRKIRRDNSIQAGRCGKIKNSIPTDVRL